MEICRVATCQLNQWALDFEGNLARIRKSCDIALEKAARLRTGPELEICGYGCEDHFYEPDTRVHSWQSLLTLIKHPEYTHKMICDFGMPVLHRSVLYNCRVFCWKGKIVLIRPKVTLAMHGNYRESRYFAPWPREKFHLEECMLPKFVRDALGQSTAPIGLGVIQTLDSTIGTETCEELWTPQASNVDLALDGVEIIVNGSGSHHELRKLTSRLDLILGATRRGGGVYLYANQWGCDGGRLYFDGSALIAVNGTLVALGPQFGIGDVHVVCSDVDLSEVRTFRTQLASRTAQSALSTKRFPRVFLETELVHSSLNGLEGNLRHLRAFPDPPMPSMHELVVSDIEEIALGPPCWLWDYLKRSKASGFFVPLSGGADSAAVATMVASMCHLVMNAVSPELFKGKEIAFKSPLIFQTPTSYLAKDNAEASLRDLEEVLSIKRDDAGFPKRPQELANALLHTAYMQSDASSSKTYTLAEDLAKELGAFHVSLGISTVFKAFLAVFQAVTDFMPRFRATGAEDLALQNLQARIRMVFAYLLATLLPFVRTKRGGYLLVLAAGNVDECLMGYLTKYDCSSGDLNPIGSVSKKDLRRYLAWASEQMSLKSLRSIVEAKPTAELRPAEEGEEEQTDETDMGLSYEELSYLGQLRQVHRCGPLTMFYRLLSLHSSGVFGTVAMTAKQIGEVVMRFWSEHVKKRHKMTTITPSYHAEAYSPDDNRFDHRPFLYPSGLDRQFEGIRSAIGEHQQRERGGNPIDVSSTTEEVDRAG